MSTPGVSKLSVPSSVPRARRTVAISGGIVHLERHVAQPQFVVHGVGRTWFVVWADEARQFQPGSCAGRTQHDDLGPGVGYAHDGVQELALQNRPALSLEAQPDEEGRHRVEISDGDADVIEVPQRRHGVHPPVFIRQVRFSLMRLSAETAHPWWAHGSRVSRLCKHYDTTRWNALICRCLARVSRRSRSVRASRTQIVRAPTRRGSRQAWCSVPGTVRRSKQPRRRWSFTPEFKADIVKRAGNFNRSFSRCIAVARLGIVDFCRLLYQDQKTASYMIATGR